MSQGLFSSLYEQGRPFALIDTRERRDHVDGHWFGSTNVPLSVLSPLIKRLVPQHDFPIHLLDWQDKPSTVAAGQLSDLGYNNIVRHRTMVQNSFGQGFVRGEFVWSKAFGEVVANTCGLPEVSPAEYLEKHKDARLFDVRPTAEYAQFTIPGSQSLPNSLLLANLESLANTGETALLHCAGRTRSIIGACTLKAAGYDSPFAIFKGGTQAWQLNGLEREFNANRLYARESDNPAPVRAFLKRWNIQYRELDNTGLGSFSAQHAQHHLFDVSDDAATGRTKVHNIIKISGTNLIQQTDRSIARYHVPVFLFDHGSGSRAAFAAYWLKQMGFEVSIVHLSGEITDGTTEQEDQPATEISQTQLTLQQLMNFLENGGLIFDLRSSKDYSHCHFSGSHWANITDLIARDKPLATPVAVVGNNIAHAAETAGLLQQHDWQLAGLYAWNNNENQTGLCQAGSVNSPSDQSALFAGRHHGNMQDSRDYLAWEEALPGQIDQALHRQWLNQLQ